MKAKELKQGDIIIDKVTGVKAECIFPYGEKTSSGDARKSVGMIPINAGPFPFWLNPEFEVTINQPSGATTQQ